MSAKKQRITDKPESASIEAAFQHVTTMVKPKDAKAARLWFEIGWHQNDNRTVRAERKGKR